MTLEEIKDGSIKNGACKAQLNPFLKALEEGDEVTAWEAVNGNLHWLNDNGAGLEYNQKYGAKRWHENGQLSHHETPDGELKVWYENGQLYYHQTPEGDVKEWFNDGQLAYHKTPEGNVKRWHNDEQLKKL